MATLYAKNDLSAPYGAYSAQVDESAGIDAGQLVKISASATTEWTTTTYKDAVIEVSLSDASDDESLICGIAMYDADDNTEIGVATRGIFLMPVGGAVTIGQQVCQDQADTGSNGSARVVPAEAGGRQLGMALSPASTAGEYILVLCTGIAGHVGAEA